MFDSRGGGGGLLVERRQGRHRYVQLAVTDDGLARLRDELAFTPPATRRPPAKACLDWTERRSHLAGAAGAHVCGHLHDRGWVRRIGTGRAVRLTPTGEAALRDLLGISP
ncbi:hypothetical protein [Saccharothrix sp. HUAS TT1]|uniref:hypothetical protein n=1 Tax=unclassified Saccharothrix TaxID=2593673 RepID=UPI00345BBAAF